MIHYLFSEAESGHMICDARTWAIWRQLVAELAADDGAVLVSPYDDEGFPAGQAVTI